MRILLVEDDPFDVEIAISSIKRGSRNEMHQISVVMTAPDALEYLREHACDVVLLDLNLGPARGLDTFKVIAAEHPDLAVIIMTGVYDEALASEAMNLGAQGYIVKKAEASDQFVLDLKGAIERKAAHVRIDAEMKAALDDLSKIKEAYVAGKS